jgi:hypothetical protein
MALADMVTRALWRWRNAGRVSVLTGRPRGVPLASTAAPAPADLADDGAKGDSLADAAAAENERPWRKRRVAADETGTIRHILYQPAIDHHGPRWGRLTDRARVLVDAALKRHLGPGDYYVEDGTSALWLVLSADRWPPDRAEVWGAWLESEVLRALMGGDPLPMPVFVDAAPEPVDADDAVAPSRPSGAPDTNAADRIKEAGAGHVAQEREPLIDGATFTRLADATATLDASDARPFDDPAPTTSGRDRTAGWEFGQGDDAEGLGQTGDRTDGWTVIEDGVDRPERVDAWASATLADDPARAGTAAMRGTTGVDVTSRDADRGGGQWGDASDRALPDGPAARSGDRAQNALAVPVAESRSAIDGDAARSAGREDPTRAWSETATRADGLAGARPPVGDERDDDAVGRSATIETLPPTPIAGDRVKAPAATPFAVDRGDDPLADFLAALDDVPGMIDPGVSATRPDADSGWSGADDTLASNADAAPTGMRPDAAVETPTAEDRLGPGADASASATRAGSGGGGFGASGTLATRMGRFGLSDDRRVGLADTSAAAGRIDPYGRWADSGDRPQATGAFDASATRDEGGAASTSNERAPDDRGWPSAGDRHDAGEVAVPTSGERPAGRQGVARSRDVADGARRWDRSSDRAEADQPTVSSTDRRDPVADWGASRTRSDPADLTRASPETDGDVPVARSEERGQRDPAFVRASTVGTGSDLTLIRQGAYDPATLGRLSLTLRPIWDRASRLVATYLVETTSHSADGPDWAYARAWRTGSPHALIDLDQRVARAAIGRLAPTAAAGQRFLALVPVSVETLVRASAIEELVRVWATAPEALRRQARPLISGLDPKRGVQARADALAAAKRLGGPPLLALDREAGATQAISRTGFAAAVVDFARPMAGGWRQAAERARRVGLKLAAVGMNGPEDAADAMAFGFDMVALDGVVALPSAEPRRLDPDEIAGGPDARPSADAPRSDPTSGIALRPVWDRASGLVAAYLVEPELGEVGWQEWHRAADAATAIARDLEVATELVARTASLAEAGGQLLLTPVAPATASDANALAAVAAAWDAGGPALRRRVRGVFAGMPDDAGPHADRALLRWDGRLVDTATAARAAAAGWLAAVIDAATPMAEIAAIGATGLKRLIVATDRTLMAAALDGPAEMFAFPATVARPVERPPSLSEAAFRRLWGIG